MWNRVKNCTSFREIYDILGHSGTEKLDFALLRAFTLLPIIVALALATGYVEGVYDTLYLHEGLFTICGALLLLLSVLWTRAEKEKREALRNYSFRRSPWFALLAFLLPWSILSACFSADPYHAFLGTDYSYDGVLSYFLYAGFFLNGYMLEDETLRRRLIKCFCLAADFTALIIICEGWQVPVVADLFAGNSGKAACFTNSNHAAYYLCTTTAATAGLVLEIGFGEEKIQPDTLLYMASLMLQSYALFVNDTLGSMLAVYFAVFVVFPLFFLLSGRRPKGKKILIAMVPALLLIALSSNLIPLGAKGTAGKGMWSNMRTLIRDVESVSAGDENAMKAGSGRWKIWVYYWKRFLEHPLLGLGPEGLEERYTIALDYTRPHNEYLIYLSYLGLPGFAAYAGTLVTVCVNRFRNIRKLSPLTLAIGGAVVCYLFSAFFGNTKFYTYPYFWMLFGMLIGDKGESKVEEAY